MKNRNLKGEKLNEYYRKLYTAKEADTTGIKEIINNMKKIGEV